MLLARYRHLLYYFLLFAALRLYFIFTFPPFTDESIYIRWSRFMLHADGQLWASIEAFGKQPLPFWLFGILGNILNNPLIGGRLVTFVISIPLFFILYEIVLLLSADKWVARMALIIFSTSPLFILFQSLALMDGFLLSIAGCILMLLINEKIEAYRKSIYLGFLIGLGLWVKNNAVVIMFLALATYLALLVHKCRGNLLEISKRLGLCVGVIFICLLPLIMRSDFRRLLGESGQFTFTVSELLKLPLESWFSNILYVWVSFLFYFGPIFLVSVIFGILRAKVSKKLLLSWWFVVPVSLSIITIKTFTVRYFLFGTFFLVPIVSFGLYWLVSLIPRKKDMLMT